MKKKFLTATALVWAVSFGVCAEDTVQTDTLKSVELEEVSVVASRATDKTPVAFTNVTLSGNLSCLFGGYMEYGFEISNVFVEISGWANVDGLKITSAALGLRGHVSNDKSKVENVVVVALSAPSVASGSAVGSLFANTAANTTFTNVYVISPIATKDDTLVNYASIDTFKKNVTTSTLDFNAYWDLTGDYPVISTAKQYLE